MPEHKPIMRPIQLLVEGNDALAFFIALLGKMKIDRIQVQNFGGNDELPDFLAGLKGSSNFSQTVVSLGVVRDAENDPKSAFLRVCSALDSVQLPKPEQPEIQTDSEPRISILILPDANTSGMLETVCLRAVADDPVMVCIDEYFKCVNQKGLCPRLLDKARLQAFLASRTEQELLGHAVRNNYISWESKGFDHIRQFLYSLIKI
jgi:hypothetical protein